MMLQPRKGVKLHITVKFLNPAVFRFLTGHVSLMFFQDSFITGLVGDGNFNFEI